MLEEVRDFLRTCSPEETVADALLDLDILDLRKHASERGRIMEAGVPAMYLTHTYFLEHKKMEEEEKLAEEMRKAAEEKARAEETRKKELEKDKKRAEIE